MLLKLLVLVTVAFVAVNSKLTIPRKLINGRPVLDGLVPKPPKEFAAHSLAAQAVSSAHFTQKLDHFNDSDTRTWSQLYQINNGFYKTGGPIFVMISGEGAAEITWMTYGQWYKNARTYGALMFQLEHRFYGTSHPTDDTSVESLKYLTSKQALADLDTFIRAMMTQYGSDKVIVFGGSYAGNLAAWYRSVYNTAIGSIASSAPVTAEVDFTQYLDTVGYAMDYFVPNCAETVQQGFASLQSLVQSQDTATIQQLFPPCTTGLNYSDSYDIDTFFSQLINPWMGAVQYSAPDAASSEVYSYCSAVTNTKLGADPLHRLSNFYKTIMSCIDHDYKSEVTQLQQTSWRSLYTYTGTRQWLWQTCNEFGYYQSTDSTNQPFGQTVPVTYIEDTTCTMVFGQSNAQIQSNADSTNQYYGATRGQEKNVFLPNGSIDPWHNLAIYQVAPDSSDTLGYMNGTSHCYDMGDDLSTDPPQLTGVRNQITQQIGQWLK
jgi:pimeloyl-ACP methyl ester carboxylesterase